MFRRLTTGWWLEILRGLMSHILVGVGAYGFRQLTSSKIVFLYIAPEIDSQFREAKDS